MFNFFKDNLNIKGQSNFLIGSKVMAIFVNKGIILMGGVATGSLSGNGHGKSILFSPTRPSGPSWSVGHNVHVYVCPSIFNFNYFFSRPVIGPQIT